MANDSGTDSVRAPTHRHSYRRQNHSRSRISKEALDLISSLPDVILQDILSFMPTKFAIRTSLLSNDGGMYGAKHRLFLLRIVIWSLLLLTKT
ncbi:putative F-box-like domain superfamily protein [Arabidopsis thaliana]